MLLARKLIDNFINKLDEEEKQSVYEIAFLNPEAAMAKLAIKYEEIYKDYPTGFLLDLLMQHLKDKIFQKIKQAKVA